MNTDEKAMILRPQIAQMNTDGKAVIVWPQIARMNTDEKQGFNVFDALPMHSVCSLYALSMLVLWLKNKERCKLHAVSFTWY